LAYGIWRIAYGSSVPTICHKLSAICELRLASEIFLSILRGEEISELSANVSNDLKELVFRMLKRPFGM
jgi:hypothetical protein